MDLGSLICRRTNPACPQCPFSNDCQALQRGEVSQFPKPKRVKQRPDERWVVLQIINEDNEILLMQRPMSGVWGGLYTPPIGSSLSEIGKKLAIREVLDADYQGELMHAISHFKVHLEHYLLKIRSNDRPALGEWHSLNLFQKGLPAPIQKLLLNKDLL